MSVRSPYFTRLRIKPTNSKPRSQQSTSTLKHEKDPLKRKIKVESTDDAATEENKTKKIKPKIENVKIKMEYKENIMKWEPPSWKLQLDNIRLMRKDKNAPVDIMGCEKCKGEDYSEKDKRFHTLVSLMLSSQTKDNIRHAAMMKLLDHGLSAQSIIKMSDETLGKLIYPVGFWKKKISYLKRTAEVLTKEYDGDIPDTVDGLVKLPGVGPKMAYLAMTCAWNKVVGIGVDVHVQRIANRLRWVKKATSDPEKTRKELEDWLPQSYWREADWLLVGFGQQVCLPISPRCSECLNKDICPSSTAKTKIKKPKDEA